MGAVTYAVWLALIALSLAAAALALDPHLGGPHRRRWWQGLAVASAAVLALSPHVVTFSQQELLVFLTINTLVVVSYRLLALTGEFSLGHVVMMGFGAYASALLSKQFAIPVPLSILLAAGLTGLVAFVLAFPLFRMKGFYFLIGSFAAGETIRLLWKAFIGPKGISRIPGVPDIEIGAWEINFWEPVASYYLVLVIAAVSVWILWRIEHSHIGLTFHAVHWRDQLAGAVGVNTWRTRTQALVLASFFAGLAGALLAHYLTTVNPNRFAVHEMVFVLIWVIVGGTATIWGPIIGLVTLTAINEVLLRDIGYDELRPLFYGVLLVLAMLFLPNGLETLPARVVRRFRRARPLTSQG